MGFLIRSWVLCFLFCFLLTYADSKPQRLHILPYIARRSDGSSVCEDMEVFKWTYGFHECFIDRKYKDGGTDLNYIVDRILEHGEACMETSSLECRPDFRGFTTLMNKTISQMKDYAQMYLEEIYRGRENIKDLDCVESILDLKTYQRCFRDIVPVGHKESEVTFEKAVKQGISCTNRKNLGCSVRAKTAFNRIVRIILGVEQPSQEVFEVEITSTAEAPIPPIPLVFEEIKPTEAPWMWYDYLAYPFVTAWRAIVSLFSG